MVSYALEKGHDRAHVLAVSVGNFPAWQQSFVSDHEFPVHVEGSTCQYNLLSSIGCQFL